MNQKICVAPNKENKLLIDLQIKPIYPVRYAYANLFDENLTSAKKPPALSSLVDQSDVGSCDGYVARILRPGWIYIREEDGPNDGHMQIFKYEQHLIDNELQERFPKYLFKNGINAQGGLVKDGSGYPFAFVNKEVNKISIAYSEHEWSPNIIDKVNGDSEYRSFCMQLIDLNEPGQDNVKAECGVLEKLVEDFRDKQNRVLKFDKDYQSSDKSLNEDFGLDALTIQQSFLLNSDNYIKEIRRKDQYQLVSNIVALHDPIGRQKDIANIHARLAELEKLYLSENQFPLAIGTVIQSIHDHGDEKIKEMVRDNINEQEFDTELVKILEDQKLFQKRQEQLANLYKEFLTNSSLTGQIGSVDRYFNYFFDKDPGEAQLQKELVNLCDLTTGICYGIGATAPGYDVLNQLINDIDKEDKALSPAFIILRTLLTHPYPDGSVEMDKAVLNSIDALLIQTGAVIGNVTSAAKYVSEPGYKIGAKYSQAALDFFSQELSPKLKAFIGLELNSAGAIDFTHELADKLLDNAIAKGDAAGMKYLGRRIGALDALNFAYDWGKKGAELTKKVGWKLSELNIIDAEKFRKFGGKLTEIGEGTKQYVGLVFPDGVSGGLAGWSAVLNFETMADFVNQSQYDKLDPLDKGARTRQGFRFAAAISAVTVDILQVAQSITAIVGHTATKIYSAVSFSPILLKPLASSSTRIAAMLEQIIKARLAQGLIAVANFTTAIAEGMEALRAFNNNNTGKAIGHSMVAIGAAVLGAQACLAIAAKAGIIAGATSSTGVGLAPGVIIGIVAVAFMGAGMLIAMWNSKTSLEIVIANSFWGKNEHYGFWDDRRESFDGRKKSALEKRQDILQIEIQEFDNQLYMPALEMKDDFLMFADDSNTYSFKFSVPNFTPGESDIKFKLECWASPGGNTRATAQFRWMEKDDVTELFQNAISQAEPKLIDKIPTLEFKVTVPHKIRLKWIYMPEKSKVVPLRYINDGGNVKNPVGGFINDELVDWDF